ncbi:alpha/beta hydrolase [Peribacillus deserti]|uniref:Carboxylesterase n=1 Tax=Peribacillus deserti TaxID=673318 RepID=A0A2N5M0T1_9BACI|nr:alpha/beta fold hydrolase [Peribacillus deserti]PLT27968.1 carboxylesterase [Peribacillus deserti]
MIAGGKKTGCLLIHGFTGSPYEVEPLSAYLQNNTSWKISVPLLPGHGDGATLRGIKHLDWIQTAEEALLSLLHECEEVYVIGFSMGGIIACYLAAKYQVSKLILLSAAAIYVNPRQIAADSLELVRDAFRGQLKNNELFIRYKTKITKTPISAVWQFHLLVKTHRSILNEIKIPAFIAQGGLDGIVPPKSAEYIYRSIPSSKKSLVIIDESKHLICHCKQNEKLFEEIYHFLKET